jgi:hypothetical protein
VRVAMRAPVVANSRERLRVLGVVAQDASSIRSAKPRRRCSMW